MADREQLLEALNAAFADKFQSMARYILDADPYARPEDAGLLREIGAMADEDQRQADRLAQLIERMEGIPQVGVYDPNVANLNFLALDYLAGVLAGIYEKQLARYEQSRAACAEEPRARAIFEELCDSTRARLERLRAKSR